jgi:large subunit ribosomal protein L13
MPEPGCVRNRARFDPGAAPPVFLTVAALALCFSGAHLVPLAMSPLVHRCAARLVRRAGHRTNRSDQKAINVRTYSPKPADIQREWHVIDATDVVLGRLAVQTATLLRGKHKPTFAPHVDGGDFVIIVNADKVALSGDKLTSKMAYRHSGYPGGLSATPFGELLEKDPRRAIEKAVWGMLPKNRLGRQMLKKLKVYAGPNHPHQAQKAQPFEITQVSQ